MPLNSCQLLKNVNLCWSCWIIHSSTTTIKVFLGDPTSANCYQIAISYTIITNVYSYCQRNDLSETIQVFTVIYIQIYYIYSKSYSIQWANNLNWYGFSNICNNFTRLSFQIHFFCHFVHKKSPPKFIGPIQCRCM